MDRVVLANVDRMTTHGQDGVYVRGMILCSEMKGLIQEEVPLLYSIDDYVFHKEASYAV